MKKKSKSNLKKKLKTCLPSKQLLKKATLYLVIASLFIFNMSYIAIEAPEAYEGWLRTKVGDATVKIMNREGNSGGTGFHVKKPDGSTVILTNGHVCELADKDENVMVVASLDPGRKEIKKVIKVSMFTDLCEVEPLDGVEGLELGNEPQIGDVARVYGHPGLNPLAESKGYITGEELEPLIMVGLITSQFDKDNCQAPKNRIVPVPIFLGIMVDACMISVKSYNISAHIYPGNSGSAVVDGRGRVISVVYAGDRFGFGMSLNYSDMIEFLSGTKE